VKRDDIEINRRTSLYKGFFEMSLYTFRHRLFDGGWSGTMTREVFERDPVAAVLPYDPVRDTVVLLEQFRPGIMAADHPNPWTVEVVAGIIEDGETPEAMCHREAMEEAGCTLGELVPIANFFPSPGGCTEYVYLYCGRVDSEGLGGIHGLDHEEEDIRVFVESTDDALRRMESGSIGNATAILALQWLALHRAKLQARWT
jgi:ADP-ribose pyrophosphatase